MDPYLANLDLDPPRQPSPLRRGLLPALIVNAIFFGGVALSLNWPVGDSRSDAQVNAAAPEAAAPTSAPGDAPGDTRAMGAAPATATPPPTDAAAAVNPGSRTTGSMTRAKPAAAAASSTARPSPPPRARQQGADAGPSAAQLTTVSVQPSFDCVKARSRTERLICGDPELAQLDRDTGRLHARAKAAARNPAAFRRQNDREWKQREAECGDKTCLLAWYAHRRQQLQQTVAHAH